MPFVHIEQITPELTWRLRHSELYPNGTIYDMGMPEDEDGIHFGAFLDHQLVGVVSLFQHGADFQFRKFAVDRTLQRTGIGRQLLQYITERAVEGGATRLWCNARDTATGFYAKAGFTETGEPFSKNGFNYIVMEKAV
jgi:GNAT superfamily N-acetyltransferase